MMRIVLFDILVLVVYAVVYLATSLVVLSLGQLLIRDTVRNCLVLPISFLNKRFGTPLDLLDFRFTIEIDNLLGLVVNVDEGQVGFISEYKTKLAFLGLVPA